MGGMVFGGDLSSFCLLFDFVLWSTIGDVREGSDEEHSIWSGGKKIFDLLQCGWEEKREKRKYDKNNSIRLWKYLKIW